MRQSEFEVNMNLPNASLYQANLSGGGSSAKNSNPGMRNKVGTQARGAVGGVMIPQN
jgi:hypothetical protein